MPTIRIPTPLRKYVGGQAEVVIVGPTADETLGNLIKRYPELYFEEVNYADANRTGPAW